MEIVVARVVASGRIGEVCPDISPQLAGMCLRHAGIYVPFRKSLVVSAINPARREARRASLAPITIRGMARPPKVDMPRRSRRIRLAVENLVLTGECQHRFWEG